MKIYHMDKSLSREELKEKSGIDRIDLVVCSWMHVAQ